LWTTTEENNAYVVNRNVAPCETLERKYDSAQFTECVFETIRTTPSPLLRRACASKWNQHAGLSNPCAATLFVSVTTLMSVNWQTLKMDLFMHIAFTTYDQIPDLQTTHVYHNNILHQTGGLDRSKFIGQGQNRVRRSGKATGKNAICACCWALLTIQTLKGKLL
jgi:hypothetical protein